MSDISVVSIAHPHMSGCVLVVDDTATNRRILSRLLQQNGYVVYEASDGQSAISLAKTHLPMVILLDIMMPEMDGYSVCEALQNDVRTADIPIVFLSALDAPFDKVQAFQKGAADYITKPFQAEEVLARVRHQVNLQIAQREQQRLRAELESRIEERTHQLQIVNSQLREGTLTDRLTRLPNRLAFVQRLSKVMAHTKTHPDTHFAVAFLDCDRFKRINDSLGHRVGDQLLKGVARRLCSIQRDYANIDTIARFGGDEFALLITDVTDKESVELIVADLLAKIGQHFALAGREIFVDASVGLVWSGLDYSAAEHLLRDADVAMYQAKDRHTGPYCWFESAMHSREMRLLQLETDLRRGLERNELELFYQPIVDLYTLGVVGFEALVRWQHPTRGLVPPQEFINFAEDTGLITQLGTQVLNMACADIARWEREGLIGPTVTVSVNMAAQQLLQPNILHRIQSAIEQAGISAHRLRLELTERSIINNRDYVIEKVLRPLRRCGVQLSIDDFGTGYSALSYLHTLPVSCLKVDRSFVQPMNENPNSLGVVPLVINIAETMGMQVIAEGIENETQLRQLRQLGCGYGQGHLFHAAMPAEDAIALLNQSLNQSTEDSQDWPDVASA